MGNTLRRCLFAAILLLGFSAPAAAQSWRVIDHQSWPVWAAQGYWEIESDGKVNLVVKDEGAYRRLTAEESESSITGMDPGAGKNVGDTVEPGDVIGVIIMEVPPLPEEVIIAIIAAAVGTLAGTAFGAWLYKRFGK